ncbi:hypothetical protein TSH7_09890 [Azospirillum sp. TSH7]|uniref:hypothetical protein n=1 Tax=unclassified Azospirillum TaxID=2630922 RepID=UPI000D60AEB8|nr:MULTISPECIES: hypothetical protein [unclassified Azospirillum]PWC63980.1 hypothetical protein TSH20_18985 [Azospirillum sp. TSH20]PWC64843.1 hypothetical protein TSH7_09890 [Azospirillum sp. TSH7]
MRSIVEIMNAAAADADAQHGKPMSLADIDNIAPQELLNDQRVLDTLRTFYQRRDGINLSDDEEVRREFARDRRWRNGNIWSIGRDIYDKNTMGDQDAARLAVLQRVWERMPDAGEPGGRPLSESVLDNVAAGLLDPTNLIPGSAGLKVGARAGMAGRTVGQAAWQAMKRGAATDAAINAGAGGVASLLQQQRDKELGLRSETNLTEAAGNAVAGGIFGGVVGGVLGGAAGGIGARNASRLASDLRARGWSDADIASVDPERVGLLRTNTEGIGEAPSRTALHEEALAADTTREAGIRDRAYEEDALRSAAPQAPDTAAVDLARDRYGSMSLEIERERNDILDQLRDDPANEELLARRDDLAGLKAQVEAARRMPDAIAALEERKAKAQPGEAAELELQIIAMKDEQRRLMTMGDEELRQRLGGAGSRTTGDAPAENAAPADAPAGASPGPAAPAEATPAPAGRSVEQIEAEIEREVLDLLPPDVDDPNVIDALHDVVRAKYADELAQAEALGVGAPTAAPKEPGPMARALDELQANPPAAAKGEPIGATTMGQEVDANRLASPMPEPGQPAPGATRVLDDALLERGNGGPMRQIFDRILSNEPPADGPVKANKRAGASEDPLGADVDELIKNVPDHPIKAELRAELVRALGNIKGATVSPAVKRQLAERATGMRIAEAMQRIDLATAEAERASVKGQPRTSAQMLENGYVPDTDSGEAVSNIVKPSDFTFTDAAGDERGILRRDKGREDAGKAEKNAARIAKPQVRVVREVTAAKRHVSQDGVRVKKGETVYVLGTEIEGKDGPRFVPSSMTKTYYNRQVAEAIGRGKTAGVSTALAEHGQNVAAAARAGEAAPALEGKALADTLAQRAGRGEITPDTQAAVGSLPDRKTLIEQAYERFKTHQDPIKLREEINAAVSRSEPRAQPASAPAGAPARPAAQPVAAAARPAADPAPAARPAAAGGDVLPAGPAPVGQRFALLDKQTQTLRVLSNKAHAEAPDAQAAYARLAGRSPMERFVQGTVKDGAFGDEARMSFAAIRGEDVPAVAPAVKPARVGREMAAGTEGLAKRIGADRERLEDKLRGYAAGQLSADDVLDELIGASGDSIKVRLDMISKLGVLRGKVPDGQFTTKAADGSLRRGDTIRRLAFGLSREIHDALPELRGEKPADTKMDRNAELEFLEREQAMDDGELGHIGSADDEEAIARHIDDNGDLGTWDVMAERLQRSLATDDAVAREDRIIDLAGRAAELLNVTESALERAARGMAKVKPAFDLATVRPSQTAQTVTKVVERKAKQAVRQATEDAAAETTRPRPSKPAPERELPVTRLPDIDANEAQLRERLLTAQPGSEGYRNTAAELYRRQLAKPEIKAVRLDWETTQMTGPELVRELSRAIRAADSKRIDEVSYAIWSRGEDLPMQPPAGGPVAKAAIRERGHRGDGATMDGIPGGAPASMQVLADFITHSDPRVQATQRTIIYRALNLLSQQMRRELDGSLVMSASTVYRLAGQTPPAGVTAAFLDLTDPAVAAIRRKLGRVGKGLADTAIGLTRGVATAGDAIHEVGHLAMRTLSDEDRVFVRDAYRQAVANGDATATRIQREYSNLDHMGRAEEWFSEGMAGWLQERVVKDDVFAKRNSGGDFDLAVRGRLSRLLDDVVQRVAYLTNGLIGRKSMRQVYRSLTLYGDMIGGGRRAADSVGERARVPASEAAAVAEQVSAAVNPARRKLIEVFTDRGYGWDGRKPKVLYHGSPNGGILSRNDFAFQPSETGELGPGIYLTTSESLATAYSRRGALSPSDTARLRAQGGEEAVREAADMMADYLATTDRMGKAKAGSAGAERLTRRRDYLAEELERRFKVTPEPYVMPVYVRMSRYMDFREQTLYGADEDGAVARLLNELEGHQILDPEEVNALAGRLLEDGDEFSGGRVYTELVSAFARQYGSDPDNVQARAALNEALSELGYHGLVATSTDTGSEVSRAIHPDEVVIFKPEHIKHVEAKAFDRSKAEVRANIPAPTLTGGALEAMAEAGDKLSVNSALSMIGALEQVGADAPMVRAALRAARGTASEADVNAVRAFGRRLLLSGSERMRRFGANWMADMISPVEGTGIYEAVDNGVARKIMPLWNAAIKLPDAPGVMRRYFNSITSPSAQPASHARIVRALRRPGDAAAWNELSAQERAVAQDVRQFFRDELTRQREAGLAVGDAGEHYFPQVWGPELLARDPEGAAQGFANYFMAEASLDPYRRGSLTPDEALLSARNLVTKLIDQEGVYLPGPARTNRARADHEFQRMLRLQDPRFQANLDELERFMNPHLMGTVTRYARNSTLRVENAKRFGINSHAVDDYLRVAQLGPQAAIELLETGRRMRHATRYITANGIETEETTEVLAAPMVRPKAIDLITRAMQEVRTNGMEAARDLIVREADDPTPTFTKRAEAIAAALRDFDGEPHGLPPVEADHILAAAQRAAGRPVMGDNRTLRQGAQAVKTINSITLLSYTTLTSLSDLVMPLIRSGNMRAWLAGIRHIGQDTEQRVAMRNIGVSISELVRSQIEGMGGSEPGGALAHKVQQAFMNATGLNQWTRMNREISAIVGWEAMKAEVRRARGNYVPGQVQQNRAFRQSMRFLRDYGLEDFVTGNASLEDAFGDPTVQRALIKFSNNTIFEPNSDQIPMWAQTWWGGLLFQLKSYPLLMGRTMRDILVDAYDALPGDGRHAWGPLRRPTGDGNPWPLLYLGTVGAAGGAAAATIKDVAQSRGYEEDGKTPARSPRERSLAKIAEKFGIDGLDPNTPYDKMAGWWLESIIHLGGLGLVSDALWNTADQMDNGAFGQQRIAGTFLGPTYSLIFNDGVNVAAGLQQALMGDGSNGKERTGARSAVARIPFVGQQAGWREGIVDALAGEKQGRKKTAGGWGAGWSNGWGGGWGS